MEKKTNALDRALWEMHHEGRITLTEKSPRVFDINGGLATVHTAQRRIEHQNGGIILHGEGTTRAQWRTHINSLLKMKRAEVEMDFKDKEVPLF